jgi:hypothetical protein
MLEPVVTLTNYIMAAQCLCFAFLIYKKSGSTPWFYLFASLCIAALAGGTMHGFLPDETSTAYAILLKLTLMAIGATTWAAWCIGRQFIHSAAAKKWIEKGAILQFCVFSGVILFYSQHFLLAVLNYLPAVIFLLIVFLRKYLVTKEKALLYGVVSIMLTFAGSFVEIAGISLQYFNHFALYHIIQFIAFCLLFITAQWDVGGHKNMKNHIAGVIS